MKKKFKRKKSLGKYIFSRLFLLIICVQTASFILSFDCMNLVQAAESDALFLDKLIKKSQDLNLSEARYWHLLMHYQPNNLGLSYISAVDDSNYFLDPKGKYDPQAELEATIRFLFSNNYDQTYSTFKKDAFIARYHWLREQLSVNIPILIFSEYESWIEKIDPESVSFVFASAYMDNPTSMFGHTFLRLNKKGKSDYPLLSATTVDYVATVTSKNRLAMMIDGISGGYRGYFSVMPYHLKVRTYNDLHSRDIWEYQLNLNDDQIKKMLWHVWELQDIYFDYFYLTENCSYGILCLLEIAREDLFLTNQIKPWVYPLDVVHRVVQQKGLVVGKATSRPSNQARVMRKYTDLSAEERKLFNKIIFMPDLNYLEQMNDLSEDRKSFVIDVVTDYIKYQTLSEWTKESHDMNRWQQFVSQKSKLKYKKNSQFIQPFSESPDKAHKTSRVGFGLGWKDGEMFEEISLRAGYHDLLDSSAGYPLNSQLELFALKLRYSQSNSKVSISEFDLFDVVSLSPYHPLFFKPSWKLKLGMRTFDFNDCNDCYLFQLNYGMGLAAESHMFSREVYFAFLETDMNYSEVFERDFRLGAGTTIGVLAEITKEWKVMASGTYLKYFAGDESEGINFSLKQRFILNKNNALGLDYNCKGNTEEVLISHHYYF